MLQEILCFCAGLHQTILNSNRRHHFEVETSDLLIFIYYKVMNISIETSKITIAKLIPKGQALA